MFALFLKDLLKIFFSSGVGKLPCKSKYATSVKLTLFANSSIGYPRYLSIPVSPLINVISLMHDPVFA